MLEYCGEVGYVRCLNHEGEIIESNAQPSEDIIFGEIVARVQ